MRSSTASASSGGRDVGNVVVTLARQDIDEGTSAMHDIAEQYYRPGTA